jgi:predicted transcriptional regulator
LDRKVAAVLLLAVLTLSVCFTAATSVSERPIFFSDFQNINNLHPQLAAAVPLLVANLNGNSNQTLDQPTRLEIYSFIKSNPGVHFRGVCEGLDLSVGVVQYHLSVLERAGFITGFSDGQNKRFFEAGVFSQSDMKLISLVRHDTAAEILTILSQNPSALHKDIADRLGVSSQALSWQMHQLKKAGLISAEKTGVNVKYSLNDTSEVKLVLTLIGK